MNALNIWGIVISSKFVSGRRSPLVFGAVEIVLFCPLSFFSYLLAPPKHATIIYPNFPLTMAVDRPPSPKRVRLSLLSPCRAFITATATFVNGLVTPNATPHDAPHDSPGVTPPDAAPPAGDQQEHLAGGRHTMVNEG